jgi:hypothetical protein
MKSFRIPLAIAALLLAGSAAAQTLPSARYALAPLDPAARLDLPAADHAKLVASDTQVGRAGPLRYATPQSANVSALARAKDAKGRWDTTADGRAVWRLAIHSPDAITLELAFAKFFLPHGAELYFASADGALVRGPYTDADNTRFGGFYTPYVPGADALLEVVVPAEQKSALKLELASVYHGYRDVFGVGALPGDGGATAKSLSCEIDSACPEGDNFRSQIRAVARFSTQGFLCTGQLLNNGAGDNRRLFSTANHCVATTSEANGMVLYWKYESPTCRTNGTQLPTSIAVVQTGGATLRATHANSDATLVELNTSIPAGANAFYAGWDRRNVLPGSTAIIHHADGDEKKISLDFNPPVVNTMSLVLDGIHYDANASMDVTYDRGTTEGGSSGGALFSNEGRMIGQLGGGPPGSCTTGIRDTYGRLVASWEGGGTAATRFKDLLDPANAGLTTVDGKENCTAPQVVLSGPTTGSAGTPLQFTATAAGVAPFRVDWDIDNDGIVDRTTGNVAAATSIPVNYPTATSTNVLARVTDATGCTGQASMAINVNSPDLVVTASTPQQVCGNGNAAIEPGERWRVPVSIFNASAPTSNGHAIFTRGVAAAQSDSFGYQVRDELSGCGFSFIDLSSTPVLPLTAADAGFPASDDGRVTSPIAVTPFNFYGNTVSQLVMSTNGYLSTSNADTGGDYDEDCGLDTPDNGGTGGRLSVLHDDLVIGTGAGAGLHTQSFASCPRPSESGAAACDVFHWTHMQRIAGNTTVGDFDVEAIVYPATNEIVYQYRGTFDNAGATSAVGIQNPAVTTTLEYSCNSARIQSGRAVCLFHPGAAPSSTSGGMRLETPAVALGTLASGATLNADVTFAVPADTPCGTPLALDYAGSVDANAYSVRRHNVLSTTVGGGAACQVSSCAAQVTPIALNDGLYANPTRFGNGEGLFTIPAGNNQSIVFGAWFTGDRNRNPSWLIIQGPLADNQAIAPVLRFHQAPGPVFAVTSSIVGTAQVTVLNPNSYALTFNIDGAAGGSLESILYTAGRSSPNRTGAWYYAAESGWGQVIDDHRSGAGSEEVAINYIYDAAGNPVWTLGSTPSLDSGAMSLNTYLVHCPTCANLPDFGAFPLAAGSLTRSYQSLTTGTLSTNMALPGPLSGTWIRSNVPIQLLSVPGPQ